jgi:hypothetical protein
MTEKDSFVNIRGKEITRDRLKATAARKGLYLWEWLEELSKKHA